MSFHFSGVQMEIWPSQSRRQTFSTIFTPKACQHTQDYLERHTRDNLAKDPADLCWLICIWRSSSSRSSSFWMSHLIIKSHNHRLPVVCCQIYKALDCFDPSCEWWIYWWMEPNWAPCTRVGQPNGHNEGPFPDLPIALINNQSKKKEEFIVGNFNNYKYHFCWTMCSMISWISLRQKKTFATVITGMISTEIHSELCWGELQSNLPSTTLY